MYGALSYLSNLWDLEVQKTGGCFEVITWRGVAMQAIKGEQFLWGRGVLTNTATLKLYFKSDWLL